MKYSGSLVKKEREQIFKLFLDRNKLRFNEIEKALKIRSNMVSYHLERMQKEDLIEKRNEYYYLTKNAEKYIPIFSNIIGQELSPLPVILIAVINKDKILLIKRKKRPYKDYWSLIGGKMLLEESFKKATIRKAKEITGLDIGFSSMNSVLHERVEGDNMIKHSFILFFTKAIAKNSKFKESNNGELKWFKIDKLGKEKLIPSDLWLIQNKLNSKIPVKSAYMFEDKGELHSFKILK